MANRHSDIRSPSTTTKQDEIEFRLIYMVVFSLILLATVIKRCLPLKRRAVSAWPQGRRTIIGEARAVASSTIPYAFMV